MIITALLRLILFILNVLSGIFGGLIPSFPDSIFNLMSTFVDYVTDGLEFISYFFYWPILVSIISILIAWYAFVLIKNVVMKVIGHFLAN